MSRMILRDRARPMDSLVHFRSYERSSMELFHFARAASTLARVTSLVNARSKLRAMPARSQPSRARARAATSLVGKIEDQSFRKLHWPDRTRTKRSPRSAFTRKTSETSERERERERERVSSRLLFQRHFIAVLLSSHLEFPGASRATAWYRLE